MSVVSEVSKLSGVDESTIENILRTMTMYHFLMLVQNKKFNSFYGKMEIVDGKLTLTEPNDLVKSIVEGTPLSNEFIKNQVVNVMNDV